LNQLQSSPRNSENKPFNQLQISPRNSAKKFSESAHQSALQISPRNSAQNIQIAQMDCVSQMEGEDLFK